MVADLSTHHKLVGDLVALPKTKADWDRYRLTDEQVAFYHEHGYLAGVRILTDAQCDKLCGELAEFFSPKHPGHELWYEYHTNESTKPDTVLFHALGAWRIRPGFHDVLWHPAFTVAASQLLGGAVRFWHDQLFCKPAKHGGVVAWHQDYSYWTRTKPMAHLTCWIGLDESTRDNGCLHYIDGSHKWDLLPITGLAGDMAAIKEVLTPAQWAQFQKPTAIELRRGECSFHHPLMIHGSFENRVDRPRRATVINVFRDGTRSDSDQPPLDGVPPVPKGQAMGGQFFPVLMAEDAARQFTEFVDMIELDPKVKAVIDRAGEEAIDRLWEKFQQRRGFCHSLWHEQKDVLAERYGINWKTPPEMNPDVWYD